MAFTFMLDRNEPGRFRVEGLSFASNLEHGIYLPDIP